MKKFRIRIGEKLLNS